MPGFPRLKESYDIAVLGGGHAGLQAGLKAALLHHSACVLDRGPKYSRSYYAPRMDNIPGFPQGISGHALLDHQIAQVRAVEDRVGYFTPARAQNVVALPSGGFRIGFDWLGQPRSVDARAVVLALGVVDRILEVHGSIQPIFPWANLGIVDFCLFCDGHTLTGKSVAVIGHDRFAARTAIDLVHFEPSSLALLTHGKPPLAELEERERRSLEERLASLKIPIVTGTISGFDQIREKRFGVVFSDGSSRVFDKGFSALGWYEMNQAIPKSLGAAFDEEGFVLTDDDSRVLDPARRPIPGLYCVGDLKTGWNQIPEAWASAERAIIHAYAYFL